MNSVVNIFSIQQKMTWTMRQTADLGTQPIQSVAERYSYMGNSATVRSRNLCLTVLAINTFTYLGVPKIFINFQKAAEPGVRGNGSLAKKKCEKRFQVQNLGFSE